MTIGNIWHVAIIAFIVVLMFIVVSYCLAKIGKARANAVLAAYEDARRNYKQYVKRVLWELAEDDLEEAYSLFDMFT